ncbi:sulfonate ABC transporter substrate-binding protein [Paenibacillus paeoniae]|uniref:Putative aliphatic sulfonates-binding protein n=1 Tax=Paenibacillus paeoniae TaxID=2292705 RepID=A0A371PIB9_9BACL|nr:sulfonate ABC transporter substrate-binding protein [Paenibacillus paeoniae]REK75970.1 sulfonate ABC transporter substrate-binding protein [Paenibacillus paeoniae]
MNKGSQWKAGRLKVWISLVSLFALVTISACGSTGSSEGKEGASGKVVRIGYQKYASVNIMKERGGLAEELKKGGYTVEWTEFPGGPQLLEALNVGSLDFGHTGEAPPIFAQAAGAPLIYLAHSPESPKAESILVPENSPIQSAADLKGKKIALNKGSNVHFLLVKYLENHGVAYDDVEVVYLPPADARAAFEKGSVDAWVIWEPFYSAAQLATKARVLADGEGLVKNYEFYLASRDFATAHSKAIDIILEQLEKTDQWAKDHQKEVAELLSPALGLEVPSLEQALSHRGWGIIRVNEETIKAQQAIADTFLKLELIPEAIDVSKAVLK